MLELNFKQIRDALTKEFSADERVIVFWFDENKEFVGIIPDLELENVKVLVLTKSNTFETKFLLNINDSKSDYLVYAPFKRPEDRGYHLANIINYSKIFSASKLDLVMEDMKIPSIYRYVLEDSIQLFNSNKNSSHFSQLHFDFYTEESIKIALIATVANVKQINFDTIIKKLFVMPNDKRGLFFLDLDKYKLTRLFWELTKDRYGYYDNDPSIEKMILSFFVTYAKWQLNDSRVFSEKEDLILNKSGSVITIVDQIKNNFSYKQNFIELSDLFLAILGGNGYFNNVEIEKLLHLDVFRAADELILNQITDFIQSGITDYRIGNHTIESICDSRLNSFFADDYEYRYKTLRYAVKFLNTVTPPVLSNIDEQITRYVGEGYKVDYYYRKFVTNYDLIDRDNQPELIFGIVEEKYLDNLGTVTSNFVKEYEYDSNAFKQRNFYSDKIFLENVKTAVIISDSLRFEAGSELAERIRGNDFEVKIEPMVAMIPSYTQLGMASLLPNSGLEINDKYEVLINGQKTNGLKNRELILKSRKENSKAIQASVLMGMKRQEQRDYLEGNSLLYVYHNRIDAIGDSANTEKDVFKAVDETIDELIKLMKTLSKSLSYTKIYITSDHGFIYTRSKNKEYEKVSNDFDKGDYINRRFVLSKNQYDQTGVKMFSLEKDLNIKSNLNLYTSINYYIFKTSGGGQNYYHGGISPQEVIIPLIEAKTNRASKKVEPVRVSVLNNIDLITSLIVKVEILQDDPVGDLFQENEYRILFEDKNENPISNEVIFKADNENIATRDRISELIFNLKNQKYSREVNYYLVIKDSRTKINIKKHTVRIDILHSEDFGF